MITLSEIQTLDAISAYGIQLVFEDFAGNDFYLQFMCPFTIEVFFAVNLSGAV
jgi:hypothetical protein